MLFLMLLGKSTDTNQVIISGPLVLFVLFLAFSPIAQTIMKITWSFLKYWLSLLRVKTMYAAWLRNWRKEPIGDPSLTDWYDMRASHWEYSTEKKKKAKGKAEYKQRSRE
jgi:hypothetical protein